MQQHTRKKQTKTVAINLLNPVIVVITLATELTKTYKQYNLHKEFFCK